MTREADIAKSHGFEVVRSLPHRSSGAVLLVKKEQKHFVLKWPEKGWQEREALEEWQGGAGPHVKPLEDALLLEYFSGRHPFYWQGDDLPKLLGLFRAMASSRPENIDAFRPLKDMVQIIVSATKSSGLPGAKEAVHSLQSVPSEGDQLLHGNLHCRNIFMRDRAHIINPYGLRGDPGFDLAFLAASLAHNQEEFLKKMTDDLQYQTAPEWFPGLVLYRWKQTLQAGQKSESRILEQLARKIFST